MVLIFRRVIYFFEKLFQLLDMGLFQQHLFVLIVAHRHRFQHLYKLHAERVGKINIRQQAAIANELPGAANTQGGYQANALGVLNSMHRQGKELAWPLNRLCISGI